MSYARFGRDSDVYVYDDVGGYISCCGCSISRDWAHYSVESIVNHMREHVDAGHTVPDDLLDPDTFSDARFTPMCTAYMCRKDEGHDGQHSKHAWGTGSQQHLPPAAPTNARAESRKTAPCTRPRGADDD